MFYLISGGSGSGKSEFAENTAVTLKGEDQDFIYIATMMAFDDEAKQKIERHREMRKDKGFQTVECFTGLKNLVLPGDSTVLLDCMSNLVANEMFAEHGAKEKTVEQVIEGIDHIRTMCKHLVVVTNEIFSDGLSYDELTVEYIRKLGNINALMADRADKVIEVIAGMPIKNIPNQNHKKGADCMKKILVIGGAFQGKTKWAMEQFPEYASQGVVVNQFHQKMKQWIQDNKDYVKEVEQIRNNPSWLIISNEIGAGIVPMEKEERFYRETTGRILCELAEDADEVYRIFCGIPTKIKGGEEQ